MVMRFSLGFVVLSTLAACAGPPSTIEFVSIDPPTPRLGEIATVIFALKDYRGIPQEGTSVTFRLESPNPGVMFSPTSTMSLKGSGEVQVQLVASTGVSSVTVVADAGGGKIALSPPISFAGSNTPSGSQLTFQCGEVAGGGSGGIHAIGAFDAARNLIAGVKLKCSAHLADRRGDAVVGGIVSFITEAGAIDPGATSVTDFVGNATVTYKTSLPLPHDTDPGTFLWDPLATCTAQDKTLCNGEYFVPLWMSPNTWTRNPLGTYLNNNPAFNAMLLDEPRRADPIRKMASNNMPPENNPRDNLVAIIAVVSGEEAFTDMNDNGKFDEGEPFIDLTEPFVDANDNGTWDTDETYIDTNGNGMWDGQNGKWDSSTQIWKQERILWTGIPYGSIYSPLTPGVFDDYTAPEPVVHSGRPMNTPLLHCFGGAVFTFILSDPWWNPLAQDGTGDGCQQSANTPNVKVTTVGGDGTGLQFTYPPLRLYGYEVDDALDRTPMPMTSPPSPGCYPPPYIGSGTGSTPQDWSVAVKCTFTAAQEDGYTTTLADGVDGQIYNNLPSVPP